MFPKMTHARTVVRSRSGASKRGHYEISQAMGRDEMFERSLSRRHGLGAIGGVSCHTIYKWLHNPIQLPPTKCSS
jgi:hypothetical protein